MRFGQFPGRLAGRFGRSGRAGGLLSLYSAGHHAHSLYRGGGAGRPEVQELNRKSLQLWTRPWGPFRSLVVVFVVWRNKGGLPSDGRKGGRGGGGRESLARGLLVLADHVVCAVVDAAAAEHEAIHAHSWDDKIMINNDHCFGLVLLTKVLALSLETLPDKHASSLRIKQNDKEIELCNFTWIPDTSHGLGDIL